MSNIAEDIKRCEKLIKSEHANWIGISNQEAIRNVLKEFKKIKREKEQCKRDARGLANWQWCVVVGQMEEELKNSISKSVIQNEIDKIKERVTGAKYHPEYTKYTVQECLSILSTLEKILGVNNDN